MKDLELESRLQSIEFSLKKLAEDVAALPEQMSSKNKTPAQRAGFEVGDRGVVVDEDRFTRGSIVELWWDDGDDIPLWLLVDGQCEFNNCDGQPGDYEELHNIRKLGKGEALKDQKMTPAQKAGFSVGDRGVVIDEGSFTVGSIVELYEDFGDGLPLWLLVAGEYALNNCDGEPGAYEHPSLVRKLDKGEAALKTPAQKAGFEIGDRGVVLDEGVFSVGSIVELYEDGGSDRPIWLLVDGYCKYNNCDGKAGGYLHLDRVRKLSEEEAALKTPAQEAGFEIGDKAVVIRGNLFDVGSIVELYEDDESRAPLWLLVDGECESSHCDGKPGAYTHLSHVRKLPEGEPTK